MKRNIFGQLPFELGDWVIHDYKIAQITRIENDEVCEVKDGTICVSSSRLDCRPLNLRNKAIAESIEFYRSEINKTPGSHGLNWPDIHNYLVQKCYELIDAKTKQESDNLWQKVGEFTNKVKYKLQENNIIDGVRVLGR